MAIDKTQQMIRDEVKRQLRKQQADNVEKMTRNVFKKSMDILNSIEIKEKASNNFNFEDALKEFLSINIEDVKEKTEIAQKRMAIDKKIADIFASNQHLIKSIKVNWHEV